MTAFAAIVVAALMQAAVAPGGNYLQHTDAGKIETPSVWGKYMKRYEGDGYKDNKVCFELVKDRAGAIRAVSPEWIEVDPEKTYYFQCYLKSADPERLASAYFGLMMYDEDKNPIQIRHVHPVKDTQTVLLQPAVAGEKTLLLQDVKNWEPGQHRAVAFDAKEDFSDLPNFKLSPRVESVEKTKQGYLVTLRSPLTENYPAGTSVRFHIPWGANLYWIVSEWVPNEWKEYSGTISGMAPYGIPKEHFWKGTRYVRVFVQLGNWNRVPEEGARLLIDGLEFKEVIPE